MRRIIVTGASGLIGSHLLTRLGEEFEVHAVSRTQSTHSRDNVIWHKADLSGNPYSGLPENTEAVVYLAQSEHFRNFPEMAREVFQVNTAQVVNMLDYATRTGVKTFVYASSGGVYGSAESGISEDATIPATGNLGFYLSTKLCSEILAENYAPYMNIVLLRFFFVYGKEQKRSMLIPRLVDNIRSGNPIKLQGHEGIIINPVHVSDAAHAIQESLELKGCQRINIAGPQELSLREICEIIGSKIGIPPRYEIDEYSKPQNLIGDIENMKKYLCEPLCRFEEGILDLI